VRSNIGEVGRCQYRRSAAAAKVPASAADISAEDLAMLWAHRRVQGPVVQAFDDWMTATHFRSAAYLDPLDVFYWEHRMSCWHSNVVLESDFAFDTHVLFNSRWILERMLSIPTAHRYRGSLFRLLVHEMWPKLERWPMHIRRRRSTISSIRHRIGLIFRRR
jgi:hypothetical protein